MSDPVETSELLAFTRTVEARSLSRAAAELGVPRATIGRRLARLEERLGTRLLRRTTRRLALTDAGEGFYRHAKIVLDAVADAEQSVRTSSDQLRGTLRVSLPPMSDPTLLEVITEFSAAHPGIRVQVDFSTRMVDLVRDGYDVALRAARDLPPGLVARTLLKQQQIGVASPAYLAAHGRPRSARDLREHRCLTGFARGELPETEWPAGRGVVRIEPALSTNNLGLLRIAALRGLGIALLPEMVIAEDLASGALVPVLPGALGVASRVSIVYLERELLPAHVRAFVEALVAWGSSIGTRRSLEPSPPRATRGRRGQGSPAGQSVGTEKRAASRRKP